MMINGTMPLVDCVRRGEAIQRWANAQGTLGAVTWSSLFAPLEERAYSGVARAGLTEAEARYGPYVVGVAAGLFAFMLVLGRKVLR